MADSNIAQEFELLLLTYSDVKEHHPDWTDVAVEDYIARLRDLFKVAGAVDNVIDDVDELVPLTGTNDPNGSVVSNLSRQYYREYTTGTVKVKEVWFSNGDESTEWEQHSSFSELSVP